LLHWPSAEHPLRDTVEGLVDVLNRGLARHIGVSNFPAPLLRDAQQAAEGRIVANQVRYGPATREPELSLVAEAGRLGVTLMAYSPVRHVLDGDNPVSPVIVRIADEHGVSPAAVALAWTIRPQAADWIAVVKASKAAHMKDNAAALTLNLTEENLDQLDRAFPRPKEEMRLVSF
jgi:diketogulonate reductase-like aldo/keto reductase